MMAVRCVFASIRMCECVCNWNSIRRAAGNGIKSVCACAWAHITASKSLIDHKHSTIYSSLGLRHRVHFSQPKSQTGLAAMNFGVCVCAFFSLCRCSRLSKLHGNLCAIYHLCVSLDFSVLIFSSSAALRHSLCLRFSSIYYHFLVSSSSALCTDSGVFRCCAVVCLLGLVHISWLCESREHFSIRNSVINDKNERSWCLAKMQSSTRHTFVFISFRRQSNPIQLLITARLVRATYMCVCVHSARTINLIKCEKLKIFQFR